MYYFKKENPDGAYLDENEVRCELVIANQIWRRGKRVNEDCLEFDTDEEAIEFYKLTPYIPPTPEPTLEETPEEES